MYVQNPASLSTEERDQMRRERVGCQPCRVIQDDNEAYTIFCYESAGRPCAVAFKGKALKPVFRYRFQSQEHREQHCADWAQAVEADRARASERRTERNKPHSLSVGDVLRSSWGYEQTNVDYYEVVALNGQTMVTICRIGADSAPDAWMQGKSTPCPGGYIGSPHRHRVDGATNAVRLSSFQMAAKMEPIAYAGGVPVYKASHWTAYA